MTFVTNEKISEKNRHLLIQAIPYGDKVINSVVKDFVSLEQEINKLKKKISDAQELIPYFVSMGNSLDEELGGRDFNYDENVSRLKKALK